MDAARVRQHPHATLTPQPGQAFLAPTMRVLPGALPYLVRADYVTDAVHAKRVGPAGRARRAARDMTILSPIPQRPTSRSAFCTCLTMSSVWRTGGTMNVSTPQVSASWLRVACSGVKASSGIGDRYLASRLAVSPDMVNATSAMALTTAPTSAAARAIAPPVVVGAPGSEEVTCRHSRSAPTTILAIVPTASAAYARMLVSADTMSASAPSSTALATSDASALVGLGAEIIDSSICVATMTGLAWS